MERLCFDEQQRTEYEKLIQEHRKSIREAQDSMILLKNQLYSTLKSNADASNRNKIIAVLGDLQKKIENIHYYHFQAIKSLCKPEQHIKFDSLCSDITGLFPQRGQKHPNEK
jgi:predicted ATPase